MSPFLQCVILLFTEGSRAAERDLEKPSDIFCIKKTLILFIMKAQIFLIVLFFSTVVTMQLYSITFLTLSPPKSAYLFAHNLNRCMPSVEES